MTVTLQLCRLYLLANCSPPPPAASRTGTAGVFFSPQISRHSQEGSPMTPVPRSRWFATSLRAPLLASAGGVRA